MGDSDSGPGTRTARVLIRPVTQGDMRDFLASVRRSRRLHHPWTAPPDSPAKFRAHLMRMRPPSNYAFLICRRSDQAAIGVINLTNVVRGQFQSGYLGYYAFAGYEGQGYMKAGMNAVVRHAFKVLRLHRVEANIQPGNVASLALVRACGFRREGYSPRYLKINGRWRDHERWAILAS
jgi:ribosomal-protein-alanine N-acetyltransferase